MEKLRKFISLRNRFQATENIVDTLLCGHELLLSLKDIESKNIQNFVNEIQEYLSFDLEKEDDWKEAKIFLPEIKTGIMIKKILTQEQSYKEWNPEVEGHSNMHSIIKKNVAELLELYSIHYEFLVLKPI